MSRSHSVEDAVFEEVHAITYEVWTLPREDAPAQPAITGISTIVEAFELMEHYGGNALFYVRDSRGRGVTSVTRQTQGAAKNEPAVTAPQGQVGGRRSWWRKALKLYIWIAAVLGGGTIIEIWAYIFYDVEIEGSGMYFVSLLILIPIWRIVEGGRK